MKNVIWITTFREIKGSLGRYLAILAIIALGVGFFSGLKVTDPAMRESMNVYMERTQFYDYRLISTLGFDDEDIEKMSNELECRAIEGAISFDILVDKDNGLAKTVKCHSITTDVNKIVLVSGHFPESPDECVVDAYSFKEDEIGNVLKISSSNDEADSSHFAYTEYKIVGLVKSPLYIQYERGNTSIGDGVIDAFVYMNEDAFNSEYYTDVYVKLDSDLELYSDEYKQLIDETTEDWQTALDDNANEKYERILAEIEEQKAAYLASNVSMGSEDAVKNAQSSLNAYQNKLAGTSANIAAYEQKSAELEAKAAVLNAQIHEMENSGLTQEQLAASADYAYAKAELDACLKEYSNLQNTIAVARSSYEDGMLAYEGMEKQYESAKNNSSDDKDEEESEEESAIEVEEPETYLLGRTSNLGYNCFESDSSIVDGIANVFPILFFLVAALVCMTTMSRMVEDKRGQIGIFKALGYENVQIAKVFIFYSGSAAVIGIVVGFFMGTFLFPQAIWHAYQIMYSTRGLDYYFSPSILIISSVIALICSVGVTLVVLRYELSERPASLMRPKAPKPGKRIFLECITFIWNRLSFLMKVSLRNIFRYKGRLFMMVIGIGGCTALLVTGLGLYDSITDIAESQYASISKYDLALTFRKPQEKMIDEVEKLGYSEGDYLVFYETSVDINSDTGSKNVYLDVFSEDTELDSFIDLHTKEGKHIDLPGVDEVVINEGLARQFGIQIGDTVEFSSELIKPFEVKVSAINQNFIYNYAYISEETYRKNVGDVNDRRNVYLNISDEEDARYVGARLMENENVAAVTASVEMLERVSNMMRSMNIIVYLVIFCAAALAFVVVYNLTNINITERIREIATIKVLGFYSNESRSYVFRENILLTIMGAIVGLILGKILHIYVMSQIVVDLITFDVRITYRSYLISFVLTLVFTILVNFFMNKKIDKISMAESLKEVE